MKVFDVAGFIHNVQCVANELQIIARCGFFRSPTTLLFLTLPGSRILTFTTPKAEIATIIVCETALADGDSIIIGVPRFDQAFDRLMLISKSGS